MQREQTNSQRLRQLQLYMLVLPKGCVSISKIQEVVNVNNFKRSE